MSNFPEFLDRFSFSSDQKADLSTLIPNESGLWSKLEENQALTVLYDEYANDVYRWCRRLGLLESDAEDAMQETFIIAHRKGFNGNEASPSTWLYQIARRVAANKRRLSWLNRISISTALSNASNTADHFENTETNLAVQQIIRKMNFKLAEVLLLHDLEGYTREQISEMVGVSSGTVAGRLRLGRKDFMKRWRRLHDGDFA